MKKSILYFAILLFLLQSCFKNRDCESYVKGVKSMNLPQLSTINYNTVTTVFYYLGMWSKCNSPICYVDTLMMFGFVTDTFNIEKGFYKITENAFFADNVPFVLLSVADSIKQSIDTKINNNKGKKIYVKGFYFGVDMMEITGIDPSNIIPKQWGYWSPYFMMPCVFVQNEEDIYFEDKSDVSLKKISSSEFGNNKNGRDIYQSNPCDDYFNN